MNIFILLGGIFLTTFFLGILLEKIRIPWIFAALILGLGAAFFHNPFKEVVSSQGFKFLAWLGMYFLLFLIGFELDVEKIKKLGSFIVRATFFIIFFEAFFGSLLIHFVFGYSWFVSALVALSFATVGEALLIPILDEFKIIKSKLGQSILGIGTLDDIIEILVILVAIVSAPILIGARGELKNAEIGKMVNIFLSLFVLFILSFGLFKLRKIINLRKLKGMGIIFLLILTTLFLFIGFGKFGETAALGALLAGLVVKNFLFKRNGPMLQQVELLVKSVTYGFFGPIFFFWVGIDTNVGYLLAAPLLILLVIVVAKSAKILASYIVGRKELGTKPSLFMGVALGVRFSTSIVIIKFLFEAGIVKSQLYAILIASAIAFKFIVPFLLSFLIRVWGIDSMRLKFG